MSEGIRFIFREKVILAALSLDLLAVFFGGAVTLLPIFAQDILRVGASGLGWLRAAPAFGAALMALALAHRGTGPQSGRGLVVGSGGVWAGDDRVRGFDCGVAVLYDAVFHGRLRQHERGAALVAGADADAGPFARARYCRHGAVHFLFESMGGG